MHPANPRRKPTRNHFSTNKKNFLKQPDNEASVAVGSKFYQKALQSRDKYQELAREALVSGDRVAAEGFFQHADHYNRVLINAHEESGRAEQEAASLPAGNEVPAPLAPTNSHRPPRSRRPNHHSSNEERPGRHREARRPQSRTEQPGEGS